jgi:hypothetical protein
VVRSADALQVFPAVRIPCSQSPNERRSDGRYPVFSLEARLLPISVSPSENQRLSEVRRATSLSRWMLLSIRNLRENTLGHRRRGQLMRQSSGLLLLLFGGCGASLCCGLGFPLCGARVISGGTADLANVV